MSPPPPSISQFDINPRVLGILLQADGPIPVEALGHRGGLPVSRVRHEIDRLQATGCVVDSVPQRGVRLVRTGLGVWRDYLAHVCHNADRRIIEVYSRTSSTQDVARRIAHHHGSHAHDAIVVADEQTAGRGRLGRRWTAPRGTAVTFSRVCIGPASHKDRFTNQLMFRSAVAAVRAIASLIGSIPVRIKWPNDLMVQDRKVGGILVELLRLDAHPTHVAAVVGIGVNVSLEPEQVPDIPPGTRERMTSLKAVGRHVDRLSVLECFVRHQDACLEDDDERSLVKEWRRHCTSLAQPTRFQCDGKLIEGRVEDLDASAGLIVRTAEGNLLHLPAAITSVIG